MKQLSHVDGQNQPTMVDISHKASSEREALVRAFVQFPEDAADLTVGGEICTKKGPVIATAVIAGTMAAKKTSDLIPFCHPIPMTHCKITIEIVDRKALEIQCYVKTHGTTGVEMEAMVGALTAAATVYDMCKALSHGIVIGPVELIHKKGGKSDYHREVPVDLRR